MGRLLKQILNFSQNLSIVSNTFEENTNLGFDLVVVLITGPVGFINPQMARGVK